MSKKRKHESEEQHGHFAAELSALISVNDSTNDSEKQDILKGLAELTGDKNFRTQFVKNAAATSALLKMFIATTTSDNIKQTILTIIEGLARYQGFRGQLTADENAIPTMLTMLIASADDGTKCNIAMIISHLSHDRDFLIKFVANKNVMPALLERAINPDTADDINNTRKVTLEALTRLSRNKDFLTPFFNEDALPALLTTAINPAAIDPIRQNIAILINSLSEDSDFCTELVKNENVLPALLAMLTVPDAGRNIAKAIDHLLRNEKFRDQFFTNQNALPALLTTAINPAAIDPIRQNIAILIEELSNNKAFRAKFIANENALRILLAMLSADTTKQNGALAMLYLSSHEDNFCANFAANENALPALLTELSAPIKQNILGILINLSRNKVFCREFTTDALEALLKIFTASKDDYAKKDILMILESLSLNEVFRTRFVTDAAATSFILEIFDATVNDSTSLGVALTIIHLLQSEVFRTRFVTDAAAKSKLLTILTIANARTFFTKPDIALAIAHLSQYHDFDTQFTENDNALQNLLKIAIDFTGNGNTREIALKSLVRLSRSQNFSIKLFTNEQALSKLLAKAINPETDNAVRQNILLIIVALSRNQNFCTRFAIDKKTLPALLARVISPKANDTMRKIVVIILMNLSTNQNFRTSFIDQNELERLTERFSALNTDNVTSQAIALAIIPFNQDFHANFVEHKDAVSTIITKFNDINKSDDNDNAKKGFAQVIERLSRNQYFCNRLIADEDALAELLRIAVSADVTVDQKRAFLKILINLLPTLLNKLSTADTNEDIRDNIVGTIRYLLSHNADFRDQLVADKTILPMLLGIALYSEDVTKRTVLEILVSLSNNQDFLIQFFGMLPELFRRLEAHDTNINVKTNILLVLANLSSSEIFCARFFENVLPGLLERLTLDVNNDTAAGITSVTRTLAQQSQYFCTLFAADNNAMSSLLALFTSLNASNTTKRGIASTIATLLRSQNFRARFFANESTISDVLLGIINFTIDNVYIAEILAQIIRAMPILEFVNVLTSLENTRRITGGERQKILDFPRIDSHRLAFTVDAVKNIAIELQTIYTNSQIPTRYLARLVLGFLVEDMVNRITAANLNPAELALAKTHEAERLVLELRDSFVLKIALSPENLPWAEELSEQYLRACVNNRIWGMTTLCCIAQIANAPTMQEKRNLALNLMLVNTIKMQAIEHINKIPAEQRPVRVEVEFANLLLIKVLARLKLRLPGAPEQIPYEGTITSLVTDELVENTCTVIQNQVYKASNDDVAEFLCNGENCQAWAAIAFPDVVRQHKDKGQKIVKFAAEIAENKMLGSQIPESSSDDQKSPDDQKLFESLLSLNDEDMARISTEAHIYAEISESVERLTREAFASLGASQAGAGAGAGPGIDVQDATASSCNEESVNQRT